MLDSILPRRYGRYCYGVQGAHRLSSRGSSASEKYLSLAMAAVVAAAD
ncbi:MAG TPA: hypothetical protein GXZ52_02790 [Clostridiales bacterium]|nr:hypothetical protein [Clostridiales bacterium]